ncbi:MAG TPA: hypothetical protein VFQ61_13960 [Polyangiaceae bacterium]|nr:hypothetical protein [Polyangiaceae bacterium]
MENSRLKIAYVIAQRGGRNYWNRVGVAFLNNDGSLNVKLEAVPVNGEVHIRDYVPREEFTPPPARERSGRGMPEEEEPIVELA